MINISLQTFKTIIMKRLVSVLLLQTLCIAAMFAKSLLNQLLQLLMIIKGATLHSTLIVGI